MVQIKLSGTESFHTNINSPHKHSLSKSGRVSEKKSSASVASIEKRGRQIFVVSHTNNQCLADISGSKPFKHFCNLFSTADFKTDIALDM